MLFLSKLFIALISPIGITLALGSGALLLSALSKHYKMRVIAYLLGISALLVLWLSSLPALSTELLASLERLYPPLAIEQFEQVDAIVLLGGGLRPKGLYNEPENLTSAADRMRFAAKLYHAKKAPRIWASGGQSIQLNTQTAWSEAHAMRDFLIELGVPSDAIELEENSKNTKENALNVLQLLTQRGSKRILLVTSALHMQRAMILFANPSIEVIAAATDHEVYNTYVWWYRWLPNPDALNETGRAIKEWLGVLLYKIQ